MRKLFVYWMLLLATSLIAGDVNWSKDYNSAVAEAKKVNKPIMFVYSRHSCKYCVLLDTTTFKDDKVTKFLNESFISVTSYTDENDYTPQDLKTSSTPTIWFLYPNAVPMFQPLLGAVNPENFLQALNIVKAEFDKANKEDKKK